MQCILSCSVFSRFAAAAVRLAVSLVLGLSAQATAAEEMTPRFYRGINLNGPALTIDGHAWDAGTAPGIRCDAKQFENQSVNLVPPTDPQRATMIRSSRWGQEIDVELQDVADGIYQVFLYVWEDNDSERYFVKLNDKTVVTDYSSGRAGQWKRLGPWRTVVRQGILKISAGGGAANFSGLEVWAGDGTVPDPQAALFASAPSDEQLAFFESRIRPLLIDQCYACHSQEAEEPGGNLLLDSRVGLIRGGIRGATILPGAPEHSLLMTAVRQSDPDLKMPPESKLTDTQIADLATWITMKAPDPRTEDTVAAVKARSAIDWDKARDFWSLKPLTDSPPPAVRDQSWPAGEIDRFVQARLESAGLTPAADAGKAALIRRATFDLIGLPPSPDEVDAYVADQSPTAFSDLVDRLLASPRYGERWGRHWLDVVRYSDTAGDNSDFPIPQMYLYRNWVIDAFNRDLPYDQFVREQLAGDLLGGDSAAQQRERLIATGYIANSRRFGSRVDDYPQHLTIEDTLDNLGRTFLASTINCARCHNHKFDPITAEDYYALYGIFHSTRYPWPGIELDQRQRNLVALAPVEEVRRIEQEREAERKLLQNEIRQLKEARDQATGDQRTELDKQLKAAEDRQRRAAGQALPYETLYAVNDAATVEDVSIQLKGDPTKTGDLVPRHFLTMLSGDRLDDADVTSGRLQLAEWIVDPRNPLTARVMANRIWLHHFGRGLVPTPNDFGRQGKPPTHPELLDWLARHFIRSGWSVKSMHRTIMLSRTYRLATARSAQAAESDPTNELLSSYPRRRLDAEAIRDTLLQLAGHLDLTPGGPHPFPPQSEWKFTQHNPFKAIYDTRQRSVYLMTQRIQRHPYLAIFDGADPAASTPFRPVSTTPLQALYLLNDQFVHEQSVGISGRVLASAADDDTRIRNVWRLLFSRLPDTQEQDAAISFLNSVRHELQSAGTTSDDLSAQAWQSLVRSLVRLNEFVYLD